jgi:hypothetical protein
MWKFKGSDLLFGFILFGVFMPFQVVLLPMSQVLGFLGSEQLDCRASAGALPGGDGRHHAVFQKLLHRHSA